MKLVSANIQNFNPDLTPRQVHQAGEVIANLDPWIFVGQEIHPPDEDYLQVQKALGRRYEAAHWSTPLVHFYDRRLMSPVEGFQQRFDYPRKLAWTPVPRRITATTYRIKTRPGLPPICIIDGHFIAGGYNAAAPHTPDAKNRRNQWDIERKGTENFVDSMLAKGITCIIGADLNHPNPPELADNFRWIADNGPDHIGVAVARGGVGVRVIDKKVVKIPGDHDALYTNLELRRKS